MRDQVAVKSTILQPFRELLESVPDAMVIANQAGEIVLINSETEKLLGYDREGLLGHSVERLIPARFRDRHLDHWATYLSNPRVRPMGADLELYAIRKDGQEFPAEISLSLLKTAEGVLVAVAIRDMSESKRLADQIHKLTLELQAKEQLQLFLRRSESRYRSIVESAPYGVFRVDQNGRIAMANSAFAAMLGYQGPDEVLGLHTDEDVYLNSTERQQARDYASEDPAVGYETKYRRKDGKTITVRLRRRRLPDDDELPGGFEVFVEDITEHRSLQKQFEHAQKMEAIGRLSGGVAHDFNNLLMTISAYAQLLGESSADSEKVVEYAARIQDVSSKGATLTSQLLAFSRRQVPEPTVLDLSCVVKDLANMLSRLLGEDVEIVIELDPQPGKVRADRGQVEQVIMNLAVNARDAMPHGGRLTIATSNVALDASYYQGVEVTPGEYVLLTLTDTGIGMDAATQVHIFEPFYTTKEAGKGTGLGLATVYGIVKQSNGFIWVYSEPDKGSIFKIYLPRIDAAADSNESLQPVQAPSAGTETILLVEDEAALRNVCRVYLESKGYTVLEAGNAKDAMRICQSQGRLIDMLITDIVMPGLGGLELAKFALELWPALSVIFVSGYTDRPLDREASNLGKFLEKPFSFEALARTVRSLLDKNREILLIEDSRFVRIAVQRALTRAGYIVHTANNGEAGLHAARGTRPDLFILDLELPEISGPAVLKALKGDAITKSIPVIVLAASSKPTEEELLSEGAAACVEKADTLFENDSLTLIHTVSQVVGKARASRG